MAGFVGKIIKSGLGIFTSRIFGMVRDVLIAAYFGVNAYTDAFFVAFAVPNLFRAFFAEGALSSVFIPFLSDKLNQDGEKKASTYLTSLILSTGAMILFIVFLVIIFPKQVLLLFMPGYGNDVVLLSKASDMIQILMPYLFFITICALLTCYLNLKNSFYIPNASTAVLNIAMIVGAWLGYQNGINIMYLCYGVFIGGVLQLILVFSASYAKGYRPKISSGYDRSVNRVFHLVLPSLAGVGINQLNFMVGRIAASFLTIGSISYLYYANRLFQFPLGMFAVAVGTVTLSDISSANSAGDYQERNGLINKAINSIFLVMLPSALGLIILAEPIIQIVYGRMSFGLEDVKATASALRMYSVGLLFYSMISLFSRVFFSDKDVKTPLYGAAIGFVVNVLLNIVLMSFMGHSGIALASSIAALVNFIFLYKKISNYKYDFTVFLSYVLKVCLASAVMSLVIYIADISDTYILMTIIIGSVTYFGALFLMKIDIRSMLR